MSGDFDFIVVGSGAGGAPLAANLARAGFTVLLLEAGGDSCSESDTGRLLYEVPIFHGLSTEYPECAWNYFIRHYRDTEQQRRDSKFVPEHDGVWYPRAGTLGGCTAHNAMITVVPQDSDWDYIAEETSDKSWAAGNMHRYFERLEDCQYVARPGSLKYIAEQIFSGITRLLKRRRDARDCAHGHGFNGWLTTSETDPRLALKDPEILLTLLNGVQEVLRDRIGAPFTRLDPNNAPNSREGLALTPLAVASGKRNGPRDYLLRTQQQYPNNLTIQLGALATRILFEGSRAIGVEFLEGRHLYKADPASNAGARVGTRQVRASREVIVCGGAFNSPQLLMLSGIGPGAELERFGIPVIVDLPGVGENLQDRYEVGIVSQFKRPLALLEGATFEPPTHLAPRDACFEEWKNGTGIYCSNGVLLGIIKRSNSTKADPDLYIFGFPGSFKGYVPGYSKAFERFRDRFTWAILKAHTNNTAGRVTLKSRDATETPRIEFHYFEEGNDTRGEDLEAVVSGVEFVREMNRHLAEAGLIEAELTPGPGFESPDKLREFIRNEAWGHHASCTNKIGSDRDPQAVLDSRFRVRGTRGLRVVDASVFPKIPGYFIAAAVYMISEKAADVIQEDTQRRTPASTT